MSLSVCVFAEILGDDFPWSADRYRLKKSGFDQPFAGKLNNCNNAFDYPPYHLILLISNPPPLELK